MSNECPRCGFGGKSSIRGVDVTSKWEKIPQHLLGCLPNKRECYGQQYIYQCVPLCPLKDISPIEEGPCKRMIDMNKQIKCGKAHPILPNRREEQWVTNNLKNACKGCGGKYFEVWETCVNCNKELWSD